MRLALALVFLVATAAVGCRGSDSSVKVTKTRFDPGLSAVPGDVPDKPPPERIGDAWTMYGLWVATQHPEKHKGLLDSEIAIKGYVVNVTKPTEDRFGQSVTPHVWIADQPSRKGLYFPLTGYADGYVAMEDAAAYDKCIEACAKAKSDPRTQADQTPGRYSRIFGDCVTDLPECRALYEDNSRANYYKLMGAVLKWYVRDQVFGSTKRKAIEDELRGQGNVICEAGPMQRRVLITVVAAVKLGLDIDKLRKTVLDEIKQKYPRERIETLDPSILQDIANRHLVVFDDPQNVKQVFDLVRALRAGTDDGSALLADRKRGPELRAAIAKSSDSDLKGIAEDLLSDMLIRWFWSKADTKPDANKACVFDDLIDFTSAYNLEPIDLLTRRRAMLGPSETMTWEQAAESNQPFEMRVKFVAQSRTGFLGWTLEVTPTMICAVKANCPEYVNPIFGDVYDFGFAEGGSSGL